MNFVVFHLGNDTVQLSAQTHDFVIPREVAESISLTSKPTPLGFRDFARNDGVDAIGLGANPNVCKATTRDDGCFASVAANELGFAWLTRNPRFNSLLPGQKAIARHGGRRQCAGVNDEGTFARHR